MTTPISPEQKNLLVEEVLVQANLAHRAYLEFLGLIANPETRQLRDCWSHLQSLLSHTAMISKFMKPTRNSDVSRARAEVLKVTLDVDVGSPIFSRNARNNVEHLDERIDAWIVAGSGRILESVFDNRNSYNFFNRPEAGEQRRWFVKRVFLIEEGIFMSEGRESIEEVDVVTLSTEIDRIRIHATEFLGADDAVVRVSPFVR